MLLWILSTKSDVFFVIEVDLNVMVSGMTKCSQ